MKQKLKIEHFFPPLVSTRASVHDFLQNHVKRNASQFLLDFSNINFISRSAADEFVTFFEKNKLEYRMTNQNENILRMFQAVQNTHSQKQKRVFREVPFVSFRSFSELNDFLAVL